jgi:hypothetical protein
MTPPPPLVPVTAPGFVVLDLHVPGRPTLGEAGDYDAALLVLDAVQEQFYDQLDANGEGGNAIQLALVVAPVDATGAVGEPCYWSTVNGVRPPEA